MAPKTAPSKAALQKLVEKWRKTAAFNYSKVDEESEDSGYRRGFAAAADQVVIDLLAML